MFTAVASPSHITPTAQQSISQKKRPLSPGDAFESDQLLVEITDRCRYSQAG